MIDNKLGIQTGRALRVYVSGPMTGLPMFNFPSFDAVADVYRSQGYKVFSPADNDRKRWAEIGVDDITQVPGFVAGNVAEYSAAAHDISTEVLYRDDFNFIVNEADLFVMLPGWEKSTGARYERALAEALNIPIVLVDDDNDAGVMTCKEDDRKLVTEFLRGFNA